jgi:type I restriction enzyme M protein
MVKKKKIQAEKTTTQELASIIKSCRDIMRKDKGLSGDLDRLPMLTWIMFMKFLDDMEQLREFDAKLK